MRGAALFCIQGVGRCAFVAHALLQFNKLYYLYPTKL